ncbi:MULTISPECIES: ribbon-helix-helix domain-containing protein [Pasteurellaceae]|uniref:Ribbon-helix-helix domain-containing protein n=1 Tax=Pasteurella atlantica TaxID=2827233 RepID=A0AAW8CK28_9PAST|nr:ribbon-helix-helix domain-containing protein [Pasteurella atlantica]MBR0574247.1 CopG family transcriptional regulator [Pasteurella atlantica]MDP8038535.1 ribbon-helix-helix domain-containing protein [Pasteurella atlantica]MDP8040627.1 ribbon-helix-helix domain-containing protein [Pasteurella atlantica]MDP8042761.1 ribbon-helix-helix domain-containing protein [Pasteurella atlantica]MDP8044849.1 ribbon-helix-helix domain-containing protein [Pasteurella atlantica]
MITLRLDPMLEQQVNTAAKKLGFTRSEFIRKSIINYIEAQKTQTAWQTGEDLFGKYTSGKGNLSVDRKDILKNKIRAKYATDSN